MKYKLTIKKDDVVSFLYSMLGVYWLSGSIKSLQILEDKYDIYPTYIEKLNGSYFMIKADKKNEIGYYIFSESLEDIISNITNEEVKMSAILIQETSNSDFIDLFMEDLLLKIVGEYNKSPSSYKTMPLPIKCSEGCL